MFLGAQQLLLGLTWGADAITIPSTKPYVPASQNNGRTDYFEFQSRGCQRYILDHA